MSDTNNLRVPRSGDSAMKSVMDIMNAYNTQSKIPLYDDSSAMSNQELDGVRGRDIPLSALRPRAVSDSAGGGVAPSAAQTGKMSEDVRTIASAYNRMRGVEEDGDGMNGRRLSDELSSIERFKADYVEDMPDDDEGLIGILGLAIRNARANLEMLESLYAALSPQE